ncbi:isochorismatase family protein [Pseudofrankia sp. BMG5.36]|uniref:cysteine hydrolase family protein n=1 Tax=Pseudofrankia sp. BMG5.36 TaxID=1834512 RepID=UPI0008DA90F7|nr:isochorismatase family protein [Pseudofrankia sp. BMG5.36]OHV48887.1 isochorismatase [Pseudofrankia sp. BMG5.36]
MAVDLADLLRPAHTVLLTQECQKGVIGTPSSLPALAEVARTSGMIANVARLAAGARAAGAGVLHCIAARRPDGQGASTNARLFLGTDRSPVKQLLGTPAVQVLDEIGQEPSDLVSVRLHGVSPLGGTDADALLTNLGARTVVIVGVSTNVAIPAGVFDLVNQGYQVVVPRDAIAGFPAEYGDILIRNSLSLCATIVTTDDVLAVWEKHAAG